MVSLIVTAPTVVAVRARAGICVSPEARDDDQRSHEPGIRFVSTPRDQFPTVLIGFVGDSLPGVNLRRLFEFPDPVNETSARFVAAGVVVMAVAFLTLRDGWVLVPLTYGFLARVATGPTLSPLGQFATRVATPRFEASRGAGFHSRQVPGPPKRFAQAFGLGFTTLASLAWVLDAPTISSVLITMLVVAATLEAVFAICLGCIAYSAIWGCADCNDISARLRQALVEARQEVDDSPAAVADAPPVRSAVADAPPVRSAVADAPPVRSAVADAPAMH
jgi:Domain of unknown function (DUF4395)